jgi:hypothetical protein
MASTESRSNGTDVESLGAFRQTHELKCVPPFFEAVLDRTKPFEARKHDRRFCEGDTLHLRELWNGEYTGRECSRTITYVLVGGEFGIERGYVVMGITE